MAVTLFNAIDLIEAVEPEDGDCVSVDHVLNGKLAAMTHSSMPLPTAYYLESGEAEDVSAEFSEAVYTDIVPTSCCAGVRFILRPILWRILICL